MKAGDLVRFTPNDDWRKRDLPNWKYGILVEYHTWEKIATVLYKGELLRLRAENVTKAGKKDYQAPDKEDVHQRIKAEEESLKCADVVVTSTKQESVHQYSQYTSYSSKKSIVIPPGVDHNTFHHIHSTTETSDIDNMINPFLKDLT